jgi:hypothetical protein
MASRASRRSFLKSGKGGQKNLTLMQISVAFFAVVWNVSKTNIQAVFQLARAAAREAGRSGKAPSAVGSAFPKELI